MSYSSTTSRVLVTLYPRQLSGLTSKLTFSDNSQYGVDGAIVACRTQKAFGPAAGTWSIDVKSANELDAIIGEDDWVDISFTRDGKQYHTMRGPVDTIHRSRAIEGSGATVETYTIAGSDFAKVYERQIIWLDRLVQGNFAALVTQNIFSRNSDMAFATPDAAVRITLQEFIRPQNNNAAGSWLVPRMPGLTSRDNLVDNVFVKTNDYSEIPFRRLALQPSDWSVEAPSVWGMAKELADESLCEIYCDLVEKSGDGDLFYLQPGVEYTPEDTQMAVIFRDRPFPNTERDQPLLNSPYFTRLPIMEVPATQVRSIETDKSGAYRRNAFFYAPVMAQKFANVLVDSQYPLVDVEDTKIHGMRRQDVMTRYVDFEQQGWLGMSKAYRNIARDIHCLDHELYSGTVVLKPGRPDLRIGMRLRITYPHTASETYYVEAVANNWDYRNGVTTTATLSRGFRGDDSTFVSVLSAKIDKFTEFTEASNE